MLHKITCKNGVTLKNVYNNKNSSMILKCQMDIDATLVHCSELTCFMSFLSSSSPPPSSGTSLKFFQVPQPIYGGSNSFIFLHMTSYFLHIPGTWKNSKLLPRSRDLENIPISLPLYRPWNLEKIRTISSMDIKHVAIAGTWAGIS